MLEGTVREAGSAGGGILGATTGRYPEAVDCSLVFSRGFSYVKLDIFHTVS